MVSRVFFTIVHNTNTFSPEGRRSFKCQPSKCHLLWFYKEYSKVQGRNKLYCNYPFCEDTNPFSRLILIVMRKRLDGNGYSVRAGLHCNS